MAWENATEIYHSNAPKRPKKRMEGCKLLKQKIASIVKENVEFLGEFPSVFSKKCDDLRIFQEYESRQVQKEGSLKKSPLPIEEVLTTLHNYKKFIENQFQLTRQLATEVLLFVITDLDRVFTFDQNYAHIIGYAMKGYSLTTDVYRSMMLQTLDTCKQKGLHVPIVTSDSAFQRVAVRGSNNEPLTLFQAQKDCWAEVTKLQKSAIIAKFRSINKYIVYRNSNQSFFFTIL